MAIQHTTQVGNSIIRTVSREVQNPLAPEIQQLITDLTDSMRAADLVGMAACQIGVNLRVFVTEIRVTDTRNQKTGDPLRIFINPRITEFSKKETEIWEGCGSVAHAGLFSPVTRPTEITVEALNEKGEAFTLNTTGLLARIIQHELDHLDGKIFLDRVTDMSQLASREEYIRKVK